MKIKNLFFAICLLAIGFITLFVWYHKKPITALPPQSNTNVVQPASGIVPAASNQIASQPVMSNAVASVTAPANPLPFSLDDKVSVYKYLLDANDADIVFYGKLEDQNGNAIGNAPINFGIRYENTSGKGVHNGQVISDANGLFTISGYRGERLSFIPDKPGYVLFEHNNGGIYSHNSPESQRIHPDPNNPVVIKMWKLQGAEHLIHFSFTARIPHDGTPVIFDFHTGKIVNAGGDLAVSVTCPLNPNTREQYQWEAILKPVNGGILTNNIPIEFRFQAPDSGYDSEFDLRNIKDVKPWSSAFHGGFYFKSQSGGSYGKFDFGTVIYAIKDGLVPITLDGYVNPAGSRNLEIDDFHVTGAQP